MRTAIGFAMTGQSCIRGWLDEDLKGKNQQSSIKFVLLSVKWFIQSLFNQFVYKSLPAIIWLLDRDQYLYIIANASIFFQNRIFIVGYASH